MATVSIDDDFARFGGKSYAINKINSVEVRKSQPPGIGGALVCGLIAFVLVFVASDQAGKPNVNPTSTYVIAAIFAGLAIWQGMRSRIREYHLFLMTSSSETQAFVTHDEEEVVSLRDAIEEAMIKHSRAALQR